MVKGSGKNITHASTEPADTNEKACEGTGSVTTCSIAMGSIARGTIAMGYQEKYTALVSASSTRVCVPRSL